MTKRKALGSGLEALLSSKLDKKAEKGVDDFANSNQRVLSIPIDKITRNKNQPRQVFFDEALDSMAASIKENGQLSPIIVRQEGNAYELVAGERRWRAMQSLKEQEIDAIVMDVTDKESALIAIVENVQREQLNSIEESEAFIKLIKDYKMTHQDIAKYTGKSRSHITNILRLNDLSEFVKARLSHGQIEMGHARAVLTLAPGKQDIIIKKTISKKLSVRAVEALARGKQNNKINNATSKSHDTGLLEKKISETLGAEVKITHSNSGKGKVEIKYSSLNELQGIVEKFKK